MAVTVMTSQNSNTVKLWEMEAWSQAMQRSVVGLAFNQGIVHFAEDLIGERARGDEVTFSYVGSLNQIPKGEGGVLIGNEERLDIESMKMAMNVTRLGVLNPNDDTIEQKRTFVDFAANARKQMMLKAVRHLDASFLYQAAGYSPNSFVFDRATYTTAAQKLQVTGNNAILAPSSERILRPNGVTADEGLTAADRFSLDLIDYAVEALERSDQPIERLDDNKLILFVSPEQLVDLEQDNSGKIQWVNQALAKMIAGRKDNGLEDQFDSDLQCAGEYKNVMIYAAPRCARGVNSGTNDNIQNVARAVLMGKDALSFASPYGARVTDDNVPVKFFAQLIDYEYYKGLEARMIYGLRKMQPTNKQDVGVFVLPTYAAAHV